MIQSSLNIVLFFFAALAQSEEVKRIVKNRIFDDHRDSTAEKEDKMPYIVVCSDEAQTTGRGTKDSYFQDLRKGGVSILCVAKDTKTLAELLSAVYAAIKVAADSDIYSKHPEWDFPRLYITPSADKGLPSEDKKAVYRWLYFDCEF